MTQALVEATSRTLTTSGSAPGLPALIARAGAEAQWRYLEFFAAQIRNRNTREAYLRAVRNFLDWAETEARKLIRSIPTDTLVGLRDRALIGLMIYTFARVSAAITMNVKDVYRKQETLWVRLHEKGGKHHEMPCQHNL